MTELSRKHFFRDEQDNRTVVITEIRPNGQFKAYVLESDTGEDEFIAFGYGHSRLAAIADLNESIQMSREEA